MTNHRASALAALVAGNVGGGLLSSSELGSNGTQLNFPHGSHRALTTLAISPIKRYLNDHQRHEWLAISMAMGADENTRSGDGRTFTRSSAPSVSTRRGLNAQYVAPDCESKTICPSLGDESGFVRIDQPKTLDGPQRHSPGTTDQSLQVNGGTKSDSTMSGASPNLLAVETQTLATNAANRSSTAGYYRHPQAS